MINYQSKSVLTFLMVNQDYPYTALYMSGLIAMTKEDIEKECRTLLESGEIIVAMRVKEKGKEVNKYQYKR